jgi:hypothetical protein
MKTATRKRWNPTPGKLYQNCWVRGFVFNDQPKSPWTFQYPYEQRRLIAYHDVFIFLGGIGSKQSVPGYYTAYKVLWQECVGWLIYPENDPNVIDPIRL